MSEENKNNITYDENWQAVSTAEYAKLYENTDEISESKNENLNNVKKKKKTSKQNLITIQLIICIIIAVAALILKNIGGEIYELAHDYYYSRLNNSVVFDIGDKHMPIDFRELISGFNQNEV